MSDRPYTVFGAAGFVGSHLMQRLKAAGRQATAVTRANWPGEGTDLGHVIYAIGITADFRSRPFDTIDAHVSCFANVLKAYKFDSLLYLSSTRVYRGSSSEDADIPVATGDPDRFYDVTKLAGEALCLTLQKPAIQVARLSNLYGAGNHNDNFLSQLLADARRSGAVTIRSGPNSEKDYLHVDDACAALIDIASAGRHRIYNVASGKNVSNREIAQLIAQYANADVSFAAGGADVVLPRIDTSRLANEFSWRPRQLKDAFPELVTTDDAHT